MRPESRSQNSITHPRNPCRHVLGSPQSHSSAHLAQLASTHNPATLHVSFSVLTETTCSGQVISGGEEAPMDPRKQLDNPMLQQKMEPRPLVR